LIEKSIAYCTSED